MTTDQTPSQIALSQTSGMNELRRIKEKYVDGTLKWYRRNKTWPALWFRISGIVIIVSSISIPFFAAGKPWSETWPHAQQYTVPISSLLVAVSAALNAFFQWQSVWQKRLNIYLAMEGWIALWETQIAHATQTGNFQDAVKATEELIEKTRSIQVTETAAVFAKTQFPSTKTSQ